MVMTSIIFDAGVILLLGSEPSAGSIWPTQGEAAAHDAGHILA